jgi:acyl-CoA thioester hydrolase
MTLSINKSFYQFEVHVFDTDCYGVMWHGAYLKWLEAARDKAVADCGVNLQTPNEGWVYPVAEQNLRFRKGGRLRDKITIETQISIQGPRLNFHQTMLRSSAIDGSIIETLMEALTTCVVCDATTFKPLRRIPEVLQQALTPISIRPLA